MNVGIALVQEPNIHSICSTYVTGLSSGLNILYHHSDNCRVAIICQTSVNIKLIDKLSTPDCAVALTELNELPCFLISVYFDGDRNIEIDLLHDVAYISKMLFALLQVADS